MRLPKLAINNTAFVLMLVVFLAIFGLRSYLNMPRTENPELSIPGSSVIVVMPGASTLDMEKMVAMPVEEAINEIEDIVEIRSEVRDGLAIISTEFEFETDPKEKYEEVVKQLNSIRSALPKEIYDIEIFQWSVADMLMTQLALLSEDASYAELEALAEAFQDQAEKVKAVRSIDFFGLPSQEIQIQLDLEKMALLDISLSQVVNAIQSNNVNIPGGEIQIGMMNLNVKSSGSFQDLEEIRNCVVNSSKGKLIYLKDIAKVDFSYEDQIYITRYGGKKIMAQEGMRGIFIGISQKEGLNVLHTAEALDPIIEEFRTNLPPNVQLEMVFKQAQIVEKRINAFLINLLQGMVLVAIVIFLSLGIRSSIVVTITIPLAIIIGLGFVDMAGFGLQQISIGALVVVLGMLVDNSIVMIENINRYIALGHSKREASYLAASEIGWPVVTATLTTVLAFLPIAAMPEKVGDFIKSLPITIMITLGVSLILALSFTPVISSRVLKDTQKGEKRLVGFSRLLKWVVDHPFKKSLTFSLKRPWFVLILAILYLGGSAWMFQFLGFSFFPKAEQAQFMVQITMPVGSSLAKTDKVVREVEQILDTMPEIRSYASNIGHGNPRIYYSMLSREHDKCFAEIYVESYTDDQEEFARVIKKARTYFDDLPGSRIVVKEFEQGIPYDSPIQIYFTGKKLNVLKAYAERLEELIARQPGAMNIENQFAKTNTELYFNINKEKANMMGVPILEIDRMIRTIVSGLEISRFKDAEGEEFPILVELEHAEDFAVEDLDRVYVSSLSGKQIPIKQFVDVEFQQAPATINRYNLDRTAEVLADVQPGYTLDEVIVPVIEELKTWKLPRGYAYHIRGEYAGRNSAFTGMNNAVLIALLSIFAVLVLQFKSIKQPLLVFVAIPFAFTGMVWALLFNGLTFSFTAFIGLTSLVGIVINNSIILVDYTNVLRKRGMDLPDAIREAAQTRLTPIVLTALTTIGGLIPLTLQGGTLWAPMGWTIIGGLFVSTFLTLIIVPLCYYLFEK